MFKRIFAGLVLAFAVFSAQAGVITITNFTLDWHSGLTPETGGTGTVSYDINNDWTLDQSFNVNIAPFAATQLLTMGGIKDWLTPVIGSDITFDPVDLYSILGNNRNVYNTSIGIGQLYASAPEKFDGGIGFSTDYASWHITKKDAPISTVPEPGTLALLSIGMIGSLAVRRKQKKIGIVTRRMIQVGNHLGTMTKNKPSGNRGFIINGNYSL